MLLAGSTRFLFLCPPDGRGDLGTCHGTKPAPTQPPEPRTRQEGNKRLQKCLCFGIDLLPCRFTTECKKPEESHFKGGPSGLLWAHGRTAPRQPLGQQHPLRGAPLKSLRSWTVGVSTLVTHPFPEALFGFFLRRPRMFTRLQPWGLL